MNPRLVPLLAAYDEDAPAGAPAPEGAGAAVEEALLRTTRAALEACARPAPPPAALAAVMAAAREASGASELGPLRAALRGDSDGSVEGTLLRTTMEALNRQPRAVPPAAALASLEAAAAAAAAASPLAPLRDVLEGRPPAGAEAALLRTTLEAIARLPRPGPPSDVVASLVAAAGHAAHSSELEPVRSAMTGIGAGGGAEAALLSSTWQAVERVPRDAPPVSAVQAVLAAAHAAVPASIRDARRAAGRAGDRRPVARADRSYRGLVYLTAAIALAGLVSVSLWVTADGPRTTELTAAESIDETAAEAPRAAAPTPAVAPDAGASDQAATPPPAGLFAAVPDAGRAGRQNAAPEGEALPSPPPPPPAAPRPAPVEALADRVDRARPVLGAAVGLAQGGRADDSPGAGLAGAPPIAPTWEAGEDVRMISLRLQSLQQQAGGVAWDDPPTPLGAAETGAPAPAGFEAVGTTRAPARVQVRVGPPD